MGWEVRQGGTYYYRNERIGGRVIKTCLGNGEVARQAERLDDDDRKAKLAEVAAIQAERDRVKGVEECMAGLDLACRRMMEATLLSSGFHQHCRSWRRNRAIY